MSDTSIGNCQNDNQGNPLPRVGGACNLASMHLDASVIETPEPLMNAVQKTGLDWEFYNLDPHASAGAQPSSQNDFYGNLYSLASFFSDEGQNPILPPKPDYVVEHVMDKSPCNCNKTKSMFPNQIASMGSKDFLIFGILALLVYKTFKK